MQPAISSILTVYRLSDPMTRITQVLARLGPPPPEICLEWAWQIQQLVGDDLTRKMRWDELEVTSQGELQVSCGQPLTKSRIPEMQGASAETAIAGGTTAGDLVDQLLLWSGCSDRAKDRFADPSQRLIELTVEVASNSPGDLGQRAPNLAVGAASGLTRSEDVKIKQARDQSRLTQRRTAPGRQSRKPSRSAQERKRVWLVAIGCASIFCGGLYLGTVFLSRNSGESSQSTPTPAGGQMDLKTRESVSSIANTSATSKAQADVPLQAPSAVSLLLATSDVPELTTLEGASKDGSTTNALLAGNALAQTLETIQVASPGMQAGSGMLGSDAFSDAFVEDADGSRQIGEVTLPIPSDADSSSSTVARKADENEKIDPVSATINSVNVLEEMKKMAQAIDMEGQSELRLPTSLETQPLQIETFPPRSIQRLAETKPLVVRDPVWWLRLAVGEGLQVAPSEPQSIGGRESAAWKIEIKEGTKEGTQPATGIYVMAQLVNSRSPAIRWTILAKADDLPQLPLPVAREPLDSMQASLGSMNQRMTALIDALQVQGRVAGIPSAARSEISNRRRELESQLEIGQRVLQVVADANEITGLLGGELTVHARLDDARQPNSTGLLQFGSLEATPTTAAEVVDESNTTQ